MKTQVNFYTMMMWDHTSDLENCIQASTFSLYLTSPFHVKPGHSGASERYPIVIRNKKKQDFDFWLDKPNVKDLTITEAKSTSVVRMRCQENRCSHRARLPRRECWVARWLCLTFWLQVPGFGSGLQSPVEFGSPQQKCIWYTVVATRFSGWRIP